MRKQLKLPQHEHPQAKEILQEQTKKEEMAKLILKLTTQVKDMEDQMDILIKEKEAVKEVDVQYIPIVIPIVSTTVPSTLAEHLAPKVPLETAVSVQSIDTSATGSSTTQVHQAGEAADIVKAMEDMSLNNNEIINLKKTIQTL